MRGRLCALVCTTVLVVMWSGCVGVVPIPKGNFRLTVTTTGTGSGTVTSNPSGIACPGTCTFDFPTSSQVTLTAAAANGSSFAGWSGACTGTATSCNVTVNGTTVSATASFTTIAGSLQSINHI